MLSDYDAKTRGIKFRKQMYDLVNLDDLERMDDAEVSAIKRLVSKLFGDFDPLVKIEGVYFGERRYPHTVYLSETNRLAIAICLPRHQAKEPLARLAHLSHELVHCLSPNGPPPQATIFEEGLAEHSKIYLSQELYRDHFPDYDFRTMSDGKYRAAFDLIEKLIGYEELDGMRLGVQKLRATTMLPFCRITEHDLARHFVRTPKNLLEKLSQPFSE